MQIVLPIGGLGKRFKDAGYIIPKPFLPLRTEPLIKLVLSCYPKDAGKILVVRKEYMELLAEAIPDVKANIIVLDEKTKGPVHTLMSSVSCVRLLDTEEDILIADCDSLINRHELSSALDTFHIVSADGGVTVRHTEDPGCSYAKMDVENWVQETREKDPFTKFSTTGPYWWRHGSDFVACALKAMQDGIYSVSPCYNYLIAQGKKVKAVETESFQHLGTPEAYENAKKHHEMVVAAE